MKFLQPQGLATATILSTAVASSSLTLVPQLAFSQEILEEVIVTARKREESLQDTPIAVSAFSGAALEDLGMRDIADLTRVVPNIDVYEGNGTSGSGNIFIRGIGARNTGANYDSGVGIYVDGVYISRPDGAVLDNVDVQSLQVLRGPQGTLFGKNTTGGAVLYTTNKPSEDFEGHIELRAGNYNQRDGKLTVNVPLVGDTLMSRFSLYQTKRDGYVTNVLNGQDFNDIDRKGGQAQLRWIANDSLLFDLNYTYNKTNQSPRGQNCEVVTGIPGAGWQSAAQEQFITIPSTGKSFIEHCQANQDLGEYDIHVDLLPAKYTATTQGVGFTADWEINDNLNFKSITAWRNTEAGQSDDLDAMAIPSIHRTNFGIGGEPRETDQYSQEFQFTGSAFDSFIDYTVGVFAFYEETSAGTQVSPNGPFFNTLNIDNLAFYTGEHRTLKTENSAYSAFSQADFNFTDSLRLTLGLRYTWEERQLQRINQQIDVANLSTGAAVIPSAVVPDGYTFPDGPTSFNPYHGYIDDGDPLNDQSLTVDDSQWTPMASLQYTLSTSGFMEEGMIYGTISNGFLSGGVSEATDVITDMIYSYDPETVWNYEVGFKMTAWEHRWRLNAALFHMIYKDRQLTSVLINPNTGQISPTTVNAGKSTISGIEIEQTLIPIPNMQITLNTTFNKGEIQEFDDVRIVTAGSLPNDNCPDTVQVGFTAVDVCNIDRSDEDLPRLPKQSYYAAIQYNWETDIGAIIPLVQYSYRRGINNCFDRGSCLSGLYEGSQAQLGARLTWMSPQSAWRVTAYGKNLTNEVYREGGTPLVDTTETAGTLYNMPRSYGVEAAFTW